MTQSSSSSRREFLRLAGALAAGACIPQVRNFSFASMPGGMPQFGDYKAMVCIYLYGGNDPHNMLVPISQDPDRGYAPYSSARPALAVDSNPLSFPDLRSGSLTPGSGNPYYDQGSISRAYRKGVHSLQAQGIDYGLNGVMPEMAQLIRDQRASAVLNVGTLVRPTTRAEIFNGSADLPLFLFAHDHQQRQLQTGHAGSLAGNGWAGQIADDWLGINGGSPLGLSISYSGNDPMLVGRKTFPVVLSAPNPPAFEGIAVSGDEEARDRAALFQAMAGESAQGQNVQFGPGRVVGADGPFKRIFGETERRALETYELVKSVWDANRINYQSRGSYDEPLFQVPNANTLGFNLGLRGSLIKQLEAVAKMVHLASTGKFGPGFERQVFFVELGGWDMHQQQSTIHPANLRELSLAAWKFQLALEELGHADKVTSFTMSDFGRTLTQNQDGTDHAWGSHQLVIGGDGVGGAGELRGGLSFGEMPSLVLGGVDDYEVQGRLIPKISQDQVNAAICDWFGVTEAALGGIFPNLSNFQTGFDLRSAYLDLFG
jgi:uncharacterized protein (DUF1501 family)